jgi:uncharacterized membrane protein
MDVNQKIEQLSIQISELAQQQTRMSRRLLELMDELELLKAEAASGTVQPQAVEPTPIIPPVIKPLPPELQPIPHIEPQTTNYKPQTPQPQTPNPKPETKPGLEEFIGGNLASKVGILITLIGIFIGAKYAIEHNLVSPEVRIASGYISGLLLIGIAWRLKKRYEQYSAVLMGGGLSVMYFITYTAYSFYGLFPQLLAFALMLIFTVAAVYAALLYNRIIIAHLGLVGAYAIPILLSDNSGRYAVLFTYITIINIGILVLSFKKYWKSLFHVSFIFTWVIYGVFYVSVSMSEYFTTGIVFLCIFFFIFYATFLAYKLIKKEQYGIRDVILLLSNAFIFYGYGYGVLMRNYDSITVLGLFTLANAAIHFGVSMVVKRLQLADKALLYLLLGLVIAFITIAIPVQLDGNWVTLLWTIEALIVFYIGRTQQRRGYERLAVVLTIIAFMSLLQDWSIYSFLRAPQEGYNYFFNTNFLTGILVTIGFGTMLYVHRHRKATVDPVSTSLHFEFYNLALPFLLLAAGYFTFELEFYNYFDHLIESAGRIEWKNEIGLFRVVTILLYSMAFTALVAYINLRWTRSNFMAGATLIGSVLCIAMLLVHGLPVLNDLSHYYQSSDASYFGISNLLIRYAIIATAAILLWLGHRSLELMNADVFLRNLYIVIVQVTILTIISFEYLQWMNLIGTSINEYKLGLSIVWSVYALGLVIMGINKKKKYWRLTGIFFFIITLVKLFAYDLSQATTISKTASFISLGAILLLVSYLYNRYKDVILEEDES